VRAINHVYFVGSEGSRLIKIGKASNYDKRLRELQCGSASKLHMIGLMPGGKPVEAKLHKRFHHLHDHGEWYEGTDELWEFIVRNTTDPNEYDGYDNPVQVMDEENAD